MYLPPLAAADSLGVFTRSEAISAGWTSAALRYAVERGWLIRLRPGVFVPPLAPATDKYAARRRDLTVAAIAAVLANPSSVASHTAAGVLHQLPLWYLPDLPCITVPPKFVGDVAGAHLHRARLPRIHVVARPVATTSVPRTVVDIGREHGELSALVAADAALHSGLTTVRALRTHLRDCRGWPGVRAARRAIDFADERAESPLESVSRLKLHGFVPRPELQMSIFDQQGTFLGRSDFLWDEFGVVGEADGMQKYDDVEQMSLREEKLRQERLEQSGLIVVRWGRDDLNRIEHLVGRLREAFARAARRNEPQRWRVLRPDAA